MITRKLHSYRVGSHRIFKMQDPSESHSSSQSLEDRQSSSVLPKEMPTTGQPTTPSMHRPELAALALAHSSGSTWNKEWTASAMAMRLSLKNARPLQE